jgi:hypothetical protein
VNWPKLNIPPFATEGYQAALSNVTKNPIMASLVKSHERGRSEARVGYMEEGKKRLE